MRATQLIAAALVGAVAGAAIHAAAQTLHTVAYAVTLGVPPGQGLSVSCVDWQGYGPRANVVPTANVRSASNNGYSVGISCP